MWVLVDKGLQGAEDQHELISIGAIFIAEANETNLFKAAIQLTENNIGPPHSVMQQQQV
jgi:hypothetical protein